jgi:predicted transcriptional regulator
MKALDLRQSVLEYIKNKADHRFLKLVKAMASSYSEEETLESDTIEQYNKEIDQAIAEVERGEFYTQEEVEKMAKEW